MRQHIELALTVKFGPEKIRKLVIATMLLKNCALELTFDLADCHNASP